MNTRQKAKRYKKLYEEMYVYKQLHIKESDTVVLTTEDTAREIGMTTVQSFFHWAELLRELERLGLYICKIKPKGSEED